MLLCMIKTVNTLNSSAFEGKAADEQRTNTYSPRARARMPQVQALGATTRNTAVSWTGGKDCNLALLAAWRDPSLRVTALVCFRPEDALFRAHPIVLMEAQAEVLDLPLLHVIIPRDSSDYKAAYVTGMRQLREDHGIVVMATGDMDLVGSMSRNWIEECGEEAGIAAFLPLWHADRAGCLLQLLTEGFAVRFSCVKSPWFDASWVGRTIDQETFAAMQAMAAAPPAGSDAKALDLGGERGEYHTMCFDGPLYAHSVEMELEDEATEIRDQPGQKAGERWWTIRVRPVAKEEPSKKERAALKKSFYQSMIAD